ncbi:hypothetical protein [Mastigocladopsis repens]|nr:hypothetical protein [Mastigocladopsis repens]
MNLSPTHPVPFFYSPCALAQTDELIVKQRLLSSAGLAVDTSGAKPMGR